MSKETFTFKASIGVELKHIYFKSAKGNTLNLFKKRKNMSPHVHGQTLDKGV